MRYFQPLKLSQRTAHERLTRICFIDYDREIVLVVEHKREDGSTEIIAIGRLSKLRGGERGRAGGPCRRPLPGSGPGYGAVCRLIAVAREEKLKRCGFHYPGGESRDACDLPEVRALYGGGPGRWDGAGGAGG